MRIAGSILYLCSLFTRFHSMLFRNFLFLRHFFSLLLCSLLLSSSHPHFILALFYLPLLLLFFFFTIAFYSNHRRLSGNSKKDFMLGMTATLISQVMCKWLFHKERKSRGKKEIRPKQRKRMNCQ